MGTGGSREAAFDLVDSVPAGTYVLVADGIITAAVDVTFEIIWRRTDPPTDTVLASWQQHFEPLPDGRYDAQPLELTARASAIDYQPGDQLVFRYTGVNATVAMAYIPNGDGARANGRIPYLTLPP